MSTLIKDSDRLTYRLNLLSRLAIEANDQIFRDKTGLSILEIRVLRLVDDNPAFTGTVSGWMGCWGNIGGVLAPIVTAFFVTNYGWNNAFTATSLFGIIAIVAWIFVKPGKQLVPQDK